MPGGREQWPGNLENGPTMDLRAFVFRAEIWPVQNHRREVEACCGGRVSCVSCLGMALLSGRVTDCIPVPFTKSLRRPIHVHVDIRNESQQSPGNSGNHERWKFLGHSTRRTSQTEGSPLGGLLSLKHRSSSDPSETDSEK
jgi:hypothetical protein